MAGLEEFVTRAKRLVEDFIRTPNKGTLNAAEVELQKYSPMHMQIFQVRLLTSLMLKLEKVNGEDIEIQAGIIRLMHTIISRTYLKDVKAIKTLLFILIKQVRDCKNAVTKQNLSEEIKLATMECVAEIFKRSTSDVLEQYYTAESSSLIGQILLTAVEFISTEKYRKLVVSSMHCLMAVFYVHDQADSMDIVLRNQVADTIFIFVPKIITVLFNTALSDDKLGETLISTSIKALWRILLIMFDKGDRGSLPSYDQKSFIALVEKYFASQGIQNGDGNRENPKLTKENLEEQLNRLQTEGRTSQWFDDTAAKLSKFFPKLTILRANQSVKVRSEYAKLCCQLLERGSRRLGENNSELLESIMAMSQDEDETIRKLCKQTLRSMQRSDCAFIFDDLVDALFDKHLLRLPRVINRCDKNEQYAEFQFLNGFFQSISDQRLKMLFTFSKNLEEFCLCLISAFELRLQRDLLIEEYALRDICEDEHILHTNSWRRFKNIDSPHVLAVLCEICRNLGRTETCNIVYGHLMEMLCTSDEVVNEVILICANLLTNESCINDRKDLVASFLNEVLDERHWHLALQPDEMRRLKVKKKSDWYVDRTPGLYESAIEIRVQDCNSDDSDDDDDQMHVVTFADAQLNVLHTCIVLDALGNVAIAMGEGFKPFVFQSLHKVLLKAGSSNYNVYLCGSYALSAIRRALGFTEIYELIEEYTDYISYHMRTILKRSPESQTACDILSVVLQYSSLNTVAYLESIFSVIQEECAKAHQSENVISYLKVFHVFFSNLPKWTSHVDDLGLKADEEENTEIEQEDPYMNWLNILNKPREGSIPTDEAIGNIQTNGMETVDQVETEDTPKEPSTPELPRYVKLTIGIIEQILKFVSSKNKMQQIIALECLITGLPLLKDYEDEFLPLVHRIWQPFVERVKEKDPIVLNRCFTLLEVLAVHAKDFLLRRTLNEVLPFLVDFLSSTTASSKAESSLAQTQEFKLQSKLLQKFATLIVSMEIGGKHFNDISEAVVLYLGKKQPSGLQMYAIEYFKELRTYNGPFLFVVVMKRAHQLEFKDNVTVVINSLYGKKSPLTTSNLIK